jgi:hypothetical protein
MHHCAQADQHEGQQGMHMAQQQHAAGELHQRRRQQYASLGPRIGHGTRKRPEQHVREIEEQPQRRHRPGGRVAFHQQPDGHEQQGVVGHGAEELRQEHGGERPAAAGLRVHAQRPRKCRR